MSYKHLSSPLLMTALLGVAAPALSGCLAGEAEFDDELLGTVETLISGGTVATGDTFDAVVQLSSGCSGTKIGARRFLTAAHCFDSGPGVGDALSVTNANGASPFSTHSRALTITALHIHPTWRLSPKARNSKFSGAYDVAIFEVAEDSPEIDVLPINYDYIGDGAGDFRAVGYGTDMVSPTESGTKQWAELFTTYEVYWMGTSGYSEEYNKGAFASNIVGWTADSDDVESGDSGCPFLHPDGNGGWEITGVLAQRFLPAQGADLAPFSFGARLGNIRRWVQSPGENNFFSGSYGTLINAKSAMCPDFIDGNTAMGAELDQQYCAARNHAFDSQYWRMLYRGSGYYALVNGATGMCMSTRSPGYGDGIGQFPCDSNDYLQWWRFRWQGDGSYRLSNLGQGTCMQVSGGDTNSDARIIAGSCSHNDQARLSWVFSR